MADSEQSITESPASVETSETLGEVLRRARAAHELTIEQLATELRIEARQLEALEANRFEQIGVPVFVKGYLRQYGHRLGLDYRDLLALYYKQANLTEVQIQPSKTIKLRDERQITLWVVALIVLAVLAAGLAFYWVNGAGLPTFGFPGSAVTSTPEEAQIAPPSSGAAAAAPLPIAPVAQPTQAVLEPPQTPSDQPDTSAPAAEATAPAAAASAPAASPDAALALAERPERDPPDMAIELAFDEESWAEVTDARDRRLFYGLGAAGRRATMHGEPPFALVIGNAPVVHVTLDGAPYPIPVAGRQGKLARFSIDTVEE